MHVRDGDRAHGWRWQRRRRGMSIGAVTSIRSMDLDTLVCVESIMPCQSGRRCAPASSPAGTVNGDGEARRAQPQGEGDVWVCGVKSEVHLAVCGVRKVVPYNGPPLTQSLSRLVVAQRKVTPGACVRFGCTPVSGRWREVRSVIRWRLRAHPRSCPALGREVPAFRRAAHSRSHVVACVCGESLQSLMWQTILCV